jgi:hypothetical protein
VSEEPREEKVHVTTQTKDQVKDEKEKFLSGMKILEEIAGDLSEVGMEEFRYRVNEIRKLGKFMQEQYHLKLVGNQRKHVTYPISAGYRYISTIYIFKH